MNFRRLGLMAMVVVGGLAWSRAANAALTFSADPLAFGNVTVKPASSPSLDETITATSTQVITSVDKDSSCTTGDMTITARTFTPKNGSPVAAIFPLTMNNGDTLKITFRFSPQSRGMQSCVIDVDNAVVPPPSFTVTGTGVAPVSTIGVPNGPPVDFGAVVVGQNTSLDLSISNTTTDTGQNLTFSPALAISGANAADFTITTTPNPPAAIAPGGSTTVTISFHPSATGTRNATLTVTTNDKINSPQTVSLTGSGSSNQSISLTPATFDYGNVVAGAGSNKSFAVANAGTAGSLSVTGATITGGSWFVFTNSPAGTPDCGNTQSCSYTGLTVAAGGSQNIVVRCAPPTGSTGMQTATLTVASNSTTAGGNTAMLSCSAVKPDISISPASLAHDFLDVHVGSNAIFNALVISNVGTSPLTYTIARSSTGSSGDFTLTGAGCAGGTTCTTSLAAGSTSTYTVTFAPSASGPRGATLTITSNDQDVADQSQTFALAGNGTQAVLSAVPTNNSTIAFGMISVGSESATQGVTVTDTGNEDMSITSAVLGGANASDFLIKSGLTGAQNVAKSGGTASWTIDCKPASRGVKTATFTVANSSSNTPSYVVNLSCQGVAPNLVASPASLNFGNVREGNMAQLPVTITNNGEQTATISAVTLLPANLGYTFTGLAANDTIAAGTSKTVTVTFAPVAGMDGGPANLTIASNAVNSPLVVPINGVGQPFGVAVTCPDCTPSPSGSMDYGNVRWDNTRAEVFTIGNTGDADVTIQSIGLSAAGNFTLTGVPATPFVLTKGQSKTVTVNADPNDTMLGTFTAQLQVMTDLPSPMMMITRQLSVSSVSPALTVQPGMTVDFGGVDIDQATAKTLTITVQNTGDGPMDITSWPALTGGPFTSAAVATKSIAVGGMQTVDVSYLPTVEKSAGAGDTVDLVLTLDGLFSTGNPQPSQQKITLAGHGIDRHISLLNSPVTFPMTFDNPTDLESPPLSCDVKNTGEAPLVISALMLDASSSPAFMLLDTQPKTVAGGETASFHVAFKPPSAGTDYTATLVLMHDDEDAPTPHMSSCALHGSAAPRMVGFMPNTEIPLGITGVGVPVKLSDKGMSLTLVNHDASHDFAITGLALSGDTTQFTLIDTSNAKTIAANQTLSYDVEFTPDHAGDFSATLTVLLDNSSRVQGQIKITGTAVDLEVRGGGCSSTGGGGGGAGMIVLVLAAALWLARKRAAAAALVVLMMVTPARAGSQNVDLATFAPAPTTEVDGFEVEGVKVGDSGAWSLGVVIDSATNPLHVQSPQVPMEDHPITNRTAFDLGFAYAFGGRFEVGVLVPLLQQSGEAYQFSGLNPPDGMALGDAMVHGKMQLAGGDALGLALAATVTAPTHSADQYAGVGAGAWLAGIVGVHAGRVGLNANAGVAVHGTEALGTFQQGDAFTYGAGASYRVLTELSVVGELFGRFGVTGTTNTGAQPLEGLVGARYRMGGGIDIGAGFGRGILHGIGTPDYRGFLAITYAPRARAVEPLPGDRPPPPRVIDRGDDDGDGIINSDDKCPTDAEDKDGFQDDDGCPDPDNDGDGIPDNVDKCAAQAEDKDGFQDEDGCPDLDNDGDGIPDAQDKCPNEPEDKDGFQDNDGCDDPDNDHDGIPDIVDQCATEPETINGIQDDDGCPDKGDSSVMVQADRIEIFEAVVFAGQTATIDKRSTNVLSQVAATLRANPEFTRIRVTVHVQPRGGDDEDLTDKRAEAVRQWLIKRGIEPERLEAKGMGSSRPLVPKGQKGAAAINDRVEFIIMEKR